MVACCMIVRNGAATVEAAIRSIEHQVEEVNIYDTGSADGTLDVLRSLQQNSSAAIRVDLGQWPGDFSKAREYSFSMASHTADWILWIDADDKFIGSGGVIKKLIEQAAATDGYVLQYESDAYPNGEEIPVFRERLVRRGKFEWTAPLHEHLISVDESPFVLTRVPRSVAFVKHLRANANTDVKVQILVEQGRRDEVLYGEL